MNGAQRTQDRLREILVADVGQRPVNILEVVKSDVMAVLRNYFVLEERGTEIKIGQDGSIITIDVHARASNVKALNYLR